MIQPLDDRILVEQSMKETAVSVLIVPDEAKEGMKLPFGEVKALGSSDAIQKNGLKVGDTVFFNEYAGERVMFEDKEYLLLRIGEVLAKQV